MRIRLPLGRSLLLLCALLIALAAFLPMRLALGWLGLGDKGITARAVQGSIWSGRLKEVRIGAAPLGDLDAGLSSLQLLLGRARINVVGAQGIRGAIELGRGAFGIADMSGTIPLGAAFAPLPLDALELAGVSVRFTDGQCDRAKGGVKATLNRDVSGLNLAQGMSGNVRCEGGALLLPLQSQSGMERLGLRLFEDGRYELDLAVRPGDAALGAKLGAAGFRQTAQGYVFSLKGRL